MNIAFYPHLGSRQLWNSDKTNIGANCVNFWKVLLFIDNLVTPRGQCYPIAWYLEVDMQLYVLSMLILLLYTHYQQVSKWVIFALSLIGTIQSIIYFQINNIVFIIHINDGQKSGNHFAD